MLLYYAHKKQHVMGTLIMIGYGVIIIDFNETINFTELS